MAAETDPSRDAEQARLAAQIRKAGLRTGTPEDLVVRRRRCGRGFFYLDECSRRITDGETLARFRQLAVPPAYRDVYLASDPGIHIQAVGRDEAGRLQYRYHPDWEAVREAAKADRLATLCAALPRIRRRVSRDLRRRTLEHDRVLAGVVALIDRTHIRIGCEDYVHSGRSRGAATLLRRSASCNGSSIHLTFRGKGGKEIGCEVRAPALVRLVAELQRLPGRRLFRYRDSAGKVYPVTAADTNAYLRRISGASVTAKDFRTLAATAAAAERLGMLEPASSVTGRRRQLAAAFRDIAEMLGNTPSVTRKSYVHRRLVEAFHSGELGALVQEPPRRSGLSRGESVVASLFQSRTGD